MKKRENLYIRVARLTYALTRRTLPLYRHVKSPHTYTQPQLAASVLLMFYCNKTYRDFEDWLEASDQVCAVLGLERVPDHTTLCRMFHWMRLGIVQKLLRQLLHMLQPRERLLAGDSTGYRCSNASLYFITRRGRPARDWFKGAYTVGTESQLILVARVTHGGSANDARFLNPLRNGARGYRARDWLFLADKGFDCQAVGERDLIPPIRRNGRLVAPDRIARAELIAQARLDGLYGQRWKCETVNSVIKRKFGDTIRSRTLARQRREPIVKALIYNLHRRRTVSSADLCNRASTLNY
jgi:IS5 family transposase